jgi:SgrR family transcriptional regulator
MGPIEHYIRLCLAFKINRESHIRTTVGHISEALFCTVRNTHFILEKLKKNDFIDWLPERGRGKQSLLYFKKNLKVAAQEYIHHLLSQQKINEAAFFIHQGQLPVELQANLLQEFQHHFGFHIQQDKNQALDVLKIPYHDRMATLDPTRVAVVHEAHIVTQIFDTLVRFNKETQNIEPALAHTFTSSANGVKWVFHLRKGVLFHNGKNLTSDDVLHTFRRIQTSDDFSPAKHLFNDIKEIHILDSFTIEITLKNPNHLFLHAISSFYASIIPSETPFNPLQPIGTGPFKLTNHTPESLTLDAFDAYFQGRPYIDRVELWFLDDERIFPVNYQLYNGEQGRPLIQDSGHISTPFIEQGCHYLIFNMNKPGPHQDPTIREFICNSINKREMIKELGGSRKLPAESFLMENSKNVSSVGYKGIGDPMKGDLEVKKPLVMAVFNFTEFLEDAYWLQEKWAKRGIDVQVIEVPLETIYEGDILSHSDMFYAGETLDEDLELALYLIYKSPLSLVQMAMDRSLKNMTGKMVMDALAHREKSKRMPLFHEIEQFLANQHFIFFTYHSIESQEHDHALQGIDINAYGLMNFSKLWANKWIEKTNQ